MPHSSSVNWRSQIAGRPVEYSRPTSVQGLSARRRNGQIPFEELNVDLPEVGELHQHVAMRPEGASRGTPTAEIYVPKGEGPFPVLLHIHGGGWFTGSALGERKLGMQFCTAGFVVVNIDYALAPEAPFPTGLEDCVYAARWIVKNIARYRGDPARIAVGGGSAGGNLTMCTALALHAGDEGILDGADLVDVKVKFAGAVPQFGVLDLPRWIMEPHYYAGVSEMYIQSYLGTNFSDRLRHPLVSPVHSPHLSKLPPVYVSCGDEDALLSHSLAMTEKLTLADVPTTLSVVEGCDHEFLKLWHVLPNAEPEFRRICAWLHGHMR
ncbi:MAG: alpha/beta hydrolase [Comamonadaceae bacterium]|nr:MAG: alpha/beta hydrolase [Comamonadaceae bacterium]